MQVTCPYCQNKVVVVIDTAITKQICNHCTKIFAGKIDNSVIVVYEKVKDSFYKHHIEKM